MAKVVVSATMSLDGFITGPGNGMDHALGERGGMDLFRWYWSGAAPGSGERFAPEGENARVVERIFAGSGAVVTGRRDYDVAHGWGGTHPVNAIPIIVLTHEPPADPPRGRSELLFVTTGVADAIALAKDRAGDKDVGIAGSTVAQQALAAELVDEVFVHVAPMLLGAGTRLFGDPGFRVDLDLIEAVAAPFATHLHCRVLGPHRG